MLNQKKCTEREQRLLFFLNINDLVTVRNSLRIYIYALLRGELLPWTVHTLERQYLPLTKVQLTATRNKSHGRPS